MSVGRKLMISEQLGWITAGHVDSTLLKADDELADARQECREEMAIALGGARLPPSRDGTSDYNGIGSAGASSSPGNRSCKNSRGL